MLSWMIAGALLGPPAAASTSAPSQIEPAPDQAEPANPTIEPERLELPSLEPADDAGPKPAPTEPKPEAVDETATLPATAPPRHRTGMRLGIVLPPKPWDRKRGWGSTRITAGGPIGGRAPAAATVVAVSGGIETGWRIHNVVGIGLGIYRQPHSIRSGGEEFGLGRLTDRGHLTTYDLLILRGYIPIDFSLQPYVDVGGGLATIEPSLSTSSVLTGGQARLGLGADAWLLPSISIGFGLMYRFVYAQRSVGHGMQGFFEVGFHW